MPTDPSRADEAEHAPGVSFDALPEHLALGDLLTALRAELGTFRLLHHWTQGEFHHDLVLRLEEANDLGGRFVLVGTNCLGGVKELMLLADEPARDALWHYRCPEQPEFDALPMPGILTEIRTVHWVEPCDLLRDDARSELRPEFRRRQRGGGWVLADDAGSTGEPPRV
ncbi:MAG: hypothetical protein ACFCGT_20520 [Sandaracinaceae bacterium]